jgi:hypothetical protein
LSRVKGNTTKTNWEGIERGNVLGTLVFYI